VRVLHVTRDFPPRINGGLSTAVGGLVRASVEARLDCAVLSFDAWRPNKPRSEAPREDRQAGATVLRLGAPDQLAHARRWAGAAEVIHVHDALLWPFARELPARLRVFTVHVAQAVVAALRGIEPPHGAIAEAAALAEADRVTIPVADLAETLDISPQKLRVVPLAVHPETGVLRAPVAGRILYAGRFADIKGLSELVAAFSQSSRAHAELVIAGGLPDSPKADRRWRRRLEASVPRGLTLAGWLDPQALRREHQRAALMVVPSWFETFGLSALEAMQRGVPVVGTRTAGLASLIRDGVTGLLVPPRDAGALAEALRRLLDEPALAEGLGRAAAADVEARWLWRDRIGALLAAYGPA
jgi:glycosyltransferase involved in cell wall biosynthesis